MSTATCVILSACAVGPDFVAPDAPNIDSYSENGMPTSTVATKDVHGGASQRFIIGEDIPEEWWTLYHSPELNALIEHGIKNSPNLRAAKATLTQAEENLNALIGSTMFPNISGTYTQTRQLIPPFGVIEGIGTPNVGTIPFIDTSPPPFYIYNTSVNVSYTPDVFGGARRSIEASAAQADYQRFELEATYITLTSNIVTTAITEASLRAQAQAIREVIEIEKEQLKIIRKQLELGGVASTDVLAQESQLAQTQAMLPAIDKSLTQARNALAVLVGDYPGQDHLPIFELEDLHLPRELPVSVPSTLVRQRPDVRAAEAQLHAATAEIGVATANLLPSFPLTGNLGTTTNVFDSLFGAGTEVWSWQLQVTETLFNGGALFAQRRAAIAGFEAAYAQYQQAVLIAVQNVSDTLKALETDAQALQAYALAEKSAKQTLDIVRKQYHIGSVGYLNLLAAENTYLQAYSNRVIAEAARYSDTAALFQAMGGGWWHKSVEEDEEEED